MKIIKKIIIFISLFLININVINITEAKKNNQIHISKRITYLIKYEGLDDDIIKKLEKGYLKIKFSNTDNLSFICSKKKYNGCIFYIDNDVSHLKNNGILSFYIKNKKINKSINYNIYFNIKKGLDISSNILYKRIQKKALSCESSASADIISHLTKKNITEDDVIKIIDKDYFNRLPEKRGDKLIWGNPNKGFVGFIDKYKGRDAKQYEYTGYGVLEKPIAKIFNYYGLKTEIINKYNYNSIFGEKEHLTKLLSNLENGNMIQLWGDRCTTPKYDNGKLNSCYYLDHKRIFPWYYIENGKMVKYEGLSGEHAFYLLGYKGEITNPTYIIVWDTNTGKHTYKTKEWLRKWNRMQNRSIIISK